VANRKISILRYVQLHRGWTRVGVKRSGRGEKLSIRDGETPTSVGSYYLRMYEGKRAKFIRAGATLDEAEAAKSKQIAKLKAPDVAAAADGVFLPNDPERRTLHELSVEFIRLKELSNRDKETISAYKNLIAEFIAVSGKRYADEIVETDLLQFCSGLRQRGLSDRTVQNYYETICVFLNHIGIDHKQIVAKEHRPNHRDPDPEAYTEDEVRMFLAAVTNERHALFFECLLKTGMRERECTHLEWSDINFADYVVTVQGKKTMTLIVGGREKEIVFQTKTKRSRDITLESALLQELKSWREKNPKTRFVFGSRRDLPDGHFLEVVKETARKANLNCGVCGSCLKTKGQSCEKWFLHKFRASFATWSLQKGVDIRTVSALLGHTDIQMTARYLAAAKGKAAQGKLNAVFAGF